MYNKCNIKNSLYLMVIFLFMTVEVYFSNEKKTERGRPIVHDSLIQICPSPFLYPFFCLKCFFFSNRHFGIFPNF